MSDSHVPAIGPLPVSTPRGISVPASRLAYSDLGAGSAMALATRVFHIADTSGETLPVVGGAKVVGYLGTHLAMSQTYDGKRLISFSTTPWRVNDGRGLRPTSLALTRTSDGGFTTANGVVPVQFAPSADGGFSLGHGIDVHIGDAGVQPGVPVGDRVFYPSTARDTDFMLEPTMTGVDAQWQLRSARSPRVSRLVFNLPAGAALLMSPALSGAAEIERDGRILALIAPALAEDAAGVTVPVSYAVGEDTLTVTVHTNLQVQYPVLVDPTVSFSPASWGNCVASGDTGDFSLNEFAGSEAGGEWYPGYMAVSANAGNYNDSAAYSCPAPNISGSAVDVTSVTLEGYATQGAKAEDEVGLPYDNGSGGYWMTLSGGNNIDATPSITWASGFSSFQVGLSVNTLLSGPINTSGYNYVWVYGFQLTYGESGGPDPPTISPAPSGWFNYVPTFTVNDSDEGMGMSSLQVNGTNTPSSGTSCTPSAPSLLCPQWAPQIQFQPGTGTVNSISATGTDVLGNQTSTGTSTYEVDPSAPSVSATWEDPSGGAYQLQLSASKGSGDAPLTSASATVNGTQYGSPSSGCGSLSPGQGGSPSGVGWSSCWAYQHAMSITDPGTEGTYPVTLAASDQIGNSNGGPGPSLLVEATSSTVGLALGQSSITADGSSSTTATFTLRDTAGNLVSPAATSDVSITSSSGATAGPVTKVSTGVYKATITSTTAPGPVTITTDDDEPDWSSQATATLTLKAGRAANVVLALRPSSITANGTSTSVATATVTDANRNPVTGDSVVITSSGSQRVGPVTAGATPGTYQATITSTTTPGSATITATDSSVSPSVSGTATLTLTAPDPTTYTFIPDTATAARKGVAHRRFAFSGLTLAGTLDASTGGAASGVDVSLWAAPAHDSTFTELTQVTTDAAGQWSVTAPEGCSRTLRVVAGTGASPTDATSNVTVSETVTPDLSLRVGTPGGGKLVFTGELEISPLGNPRPLVKIEVWALGAWHRVGRPTQVGVDGSYRDIFQSEAGTIGRRYTFRAVTRATSLWQAGVSGLLSAVVR
ncbi:MAG: Ig-like domain-containing protein [Solirubrobacteraceae bacterium]